MENQASALDPEAQRDSIPFIYFNGFAMGVTTSDMFLVLAHDGAPQVRLSLSYTTAKTLAAKLHAAVKDLEVKSERTIMSIDEVADHLRSVGPKPLSGTPEPKQ